MGYRYDDLAPGEVYHIYTRGVEKRNIFIDKVDRQRFIALLSHCLTSGPSRSYSISQRLKQENSLPKIGEGLVDLLCYCMMDNHIHLLVHENIEGGTSLYMQRLLTSYSCYFNIRHDRSGSLFIHPFKAVLVDKDDQLLHVSRYIHLNPYKAHIINRVHDFKWSSLGEYMSPGSQEDLCHHKIILGIMTSKEYRSFIEGEIKHEHSLIDIEYLLVDYED